MKAQYLVLVLLFGFASVEAPAQSTPPKPTWHEDSQTFTCPTGFDVHVGEKQGVPFVSCVVIKEAPSAPPQASGGFDFGFKPVPPVAAQTAPPPPPGFVQVTPIRATQQRAPSQKDIPAIAKSANGSIVSIVMSDKDSKPLGQGSGFLVSNDGLLVTNYHVIAEGVSAVAKLPDGAFYLIDGVVASDKSRDVAVLKAHGHNFRPLSLGNSDRVQVGEEVVAIGSPLSLESTVSNGIVSGMRTAEDLGGKFLQVTAPISPGSSGGPLFNMIGEVIGITTMYIKGGENLNFAIPINDAKRLLLSKSSTLRDWPNEHESAKTEKRDHEEHVTPTESTEYTWPDPVGLASLAHRFYEQDNQAGLFNPENFGTAPDSSKVSLGRISSADYVCFSDDVRSDEFFTFQAWAYSKEYDKAWHLLDKVSDREEFVKLQIKQMEIQRAIRQDAPYLNFLSGDDVKDTRSSIDGFFLNAGRMLKKDVYSKGIKVDTFEYHWGGTSWFFHDLQFLGIFGAMPSRGPDAPTSSPRARFLSIQLFREDDFMQVLRYAESDTDHHVIASGYCQRMKCSPQSPRCM
jgi:S1-C subfamily serine protease